MIQSVFEAVFILSVTAYLGYRIGQFIEQRRHRKIFADYKQQAQKIKELSFDLDYCTRTRRQAQHQLRMLQSRLKKPAEAPPVTIDAGGKIIADTTEAEPQTRKDYEV